MQLTKKLILNRHKRVQIFLEIVCAYRQFIFAGQTKLHLLWPSSPLVEPNLNNCKHLT